MFDLGWSEMVVVGLLALLIIGPKDLPKVMKQVARWIKQIRGMAGDFQSSLDDMVKDTDFKDAKDALDSVRSFRPDQKIRSLVDPDNDLAKELDIESDFEALERDENSIFSPVDSDAPTEPVAPKGTKPKKTAAKKATAKKTTPKKAAPKKAATKKTATKKLASAKKPATKAASTSKRAPTKKTAKKTTAKTTAKKSS